MRASLALGALVVAISWPRVAHADDGLTYEGHYANAFAAGRAVDGRHVAVMGGFHTDFPYHDPGSGYDQVAVYVEREEPLVVTGRPHLDGFVLKARDRGARITYRGQDVRFRLEFTSQEHTPLYEGDPLDIGDFFLQQGFESPSGRSPGFIYTPYELIRLARGKLVLRGRAIPLRGLHGQAEVGELEAPQDRRFRSAYDYLAAPSIRGAAYTYVGFETRALHGGVDGVLGPYFAATGSDEFTMEDGEFSAGNSHGAPEPFDNTGDLPPRANELARWRTDLGPGILHRMLVKLTDARGRRLLALSETIKEDPGG